MTDNEYTPYHPGHQLGTQILKKALVDSFEEFRGKYNDWAETVTPDSRHRIVTNLYTPKYDKEYEQHGTSALLAHKDRQYSEAAQHMDAATQTIAGWHDMLAWNLGSNHPATQAARTLWQNSTDMTSAYRKSLGMEQEDTDKKFNDIAAYFNAHKDEDADGK